MIANIVDRRTNNYDVNCDAIFEPSWHDNSIDGSTKFPKFEKESSYESLLNTTIVQAIEYAMQWDYPVTLYIYNAGEGEKSVHP